MKRLFFSLFVVLAGFAYAYDFPAGVPTDYLGLTITSSINLNIIPGIDITHPGVTTLPHYEYLREPICLGLEGEGVGTITLAQNVSYPFVSAYYDETWHKANPYEEIPTDDIVLEEVTFSPGAEVILLICRNDPFLEAVFNSFTAVYDECATPSVNISWTTSYETGITCFKLFGGISDSLENAAYLHGPIPATNTANLHTYGWTEQYPVIGYTHYYWVKVEDNLGFGHFYGPVSVAVGTPHVLQNQILPVVPNPCDNEFWCIYEVKESCPVSIILLNSSNNVVKEIIHQEVTATGSHMRRVQIADLPEGLYRLYYWIEQESGDYYSYGDVLIQRSTK